MPRRQPTATAHARPRAGRRAGIAVLLSLTAVLPLATAPTARAHESWRLPVDGDVVGGFRVTPGAPFAAGQRRGIDLQARPGTPVHAACSGRVTFVGRVPEPQRTATRRGVTVRCAAGPFVATHLGLGPVDVRAGRAVIRGARLGLAGPAGLVRLGARRVGDRQGYVNPLRLVHASGSGPASLPLLAPPPGRPVRRADRPRGPRGDVGRRLLRPAGADPAAPPLVVWVGLGLVVAAVPVTLAAGRVRTRRRARLVTAAPSRPGA